MPTIYLHVGLFKTGTTAIQDSLFQARRRLADYSVHYPDLGGYGVGDPGPRANHSLHFRLAFANPESIERIVLKNRGSSVSAAHRYVRMLRKLSRQRIQRACSTLEDKIYRKVIFSGEGITELASEELAELRDFLESSGSRVIVVVYLRNPIGISTGLVQFHVLNGGVFPESPSDAFQSQLRARLEPLLETFGKERIVFRRFPVIQDGNNDLIADFLDAVGCSELSEYVPRLERNRSLSDPAIRTLERYNRTFSGCTHDGEHDENSSREAEPPIKYWLGALQGAPFRFESSFLEELSALHRDEKAWAEDICGFNLDMDPKLEASSAVDIRPEVYDNLARLIHQLAHAHARGDEKAARDAAKAIIGAAPSDCRVGAPIQRYAREY